VSAEQGGDGTAAAWESFHLQHAAVPFFKQRRYLVAEFPQLAARGEQLTVLELGCGVGSSALPLLLSDPGVRVVACDFAPAAVEAARQAVSRAGASADVLPSRGADWSSLQDFAAGLWLSSRTRAR